MNDFKPTTSYESWEKKITSYDKAFKNWEERVKKILRKYRDDSDLATTGESPAKFNILWSNVQTIVPATYARLPKPDVSRRFRDTDPVGRVASLILERALEFEIEHYPDFAAAMKNSVFDRFLGGRGIAWVRFEHDVKEVINPITQQTSEQLTNEVCPVEYVHWEEFGHSMARTWEEVTTVWRRVFMTREALIARFGEDLGNKIPLDTKPEEEELTTGETYQATVYEIWDKDSKMAVWLSKSLGQILDEVEDPLHLDGFFPCPRPLFSTLTTDSLIPVPDFTLYQDQAEELNVLCDRIDGLIKALRICGVYDSSIGELQRLFTEGGDNALIPVKNWSAFAEKNGLRGAIDVVDLRPIVETLNASYIAMGQVKQQIYEVTGMADIIRGSTDPNETLGAQQLKGQFGSLRIRANQADIANFATTILRIKAQIMCEFYSDETLTMIGGAEELNDTDKALVRPALALLRNNVIRAFRIEVAADSLVQMDEQADQQGRMEFLKASGAFLKEAVTAGAQMPQLAPLLMAMLKFGVTGFKVGKTLEGEFDAAADKMTQMAAQPQQPKPDPEMAKIQAQLQGKQQENQLDFELDQRRADLDAQVEQHKQTVQAQQVAQQNALEQQREEWKQQNDMQLEKYRQMFESQAEANRAQTEILIARIAAAARVEVAEVTAGTAIQTAQINAANQAPTEMPL